MMYQPRRTVVTRRQASSTLTSLRTVSSCMSNGVFHATADPAMGRDPTPERSLPVRPVDGGVSDDAAKQYAADTGAAPPIPGTQDQWQEGKKLYELYCAQCHGLKGEGDGSASSTVPGGYIRPEPAVFSETGHAFEAYGQYVWKVGEGVPTTHMPQWKHALDDEEIALVIFYIQTFADPADYNAKWGPLYSDAFAREFKR